MTFFHSTKNLKFLALSLGIIQRSALMTKLKKINLSFSFFTLLFSSIAAANHAGQGRCGGWYIDVEPFYVTANDALLTKYPWAASVSTITSTTDTIAALSEDVQFYNYHPEEQWGGRVALGYDFPSCDYCKYYGFSLEYTHFDYDLDGRVIFGTTSPDLPPLRATFSGIIADDMKAFSNASGKLESQYDTLDLLAHKNVIYGCSRVQFFVGARYLRLKEEANTVLGPSSFTDFFTGITPPVALGTINAEDRASFQNRFNGAGPRLGANVVYSFGSGFSLNGEIAGNLIYGESRSNFDERLVLSEDFLPDFGGVTLLSTEEIHHGGDNSSRFVPGFSGKIGISYTAVFCNQSHLTIEIGYRGDKYFGVSDTSALIQGIALGEQLTNTQFITSSSEALNKANYQDFEFTGPYLNFTYHT